MAGAGEVVVPDELAAEYYTVAIKCPTIALNALNLDLFGFGLLWLCSV